LASITREGTDPCLAVEDATTREVFEACLEHVLVPSLRPGQVMVMDNLSAHKGDRVKELTESRGCEHLYLPPYSPGLNPIGQASSKLRSRGCCCAPRRVPTRSCWRPWAKHSRRSRHETRAGSSTTLVTVRWATRYDERFRN
jgi:transposase